MSAFDFQFYLLCFFASFFGSLALVPQLKKLAFKHEILDKPNQEHKTHNVPIPYLGGLALAGPFITLSTLGSVFLSISISDLKRLIIVVVPATIMCIVGLVDDIRNLSAQSRLLIQIISSLGISTFLSINGFTVSLLPYAALNLVVSILWLVGVTNAVNFIDNADGAAAGITGLSHMSIFVISIMSQQYLIAALAAVMLGVLSGFLIWNRNPASIYMGDCGSLFLGLVLSCITLQMETGANTILMSVLIPILVVAIPIIDSSVVVISRLKQRIPIYQGGKDHLYHRLLITGLKKSNAVCFLLVSQTFFGLIGVSFSLFEIPNENLCGIASVGIMLIYAFIFLRIKSI